MKKTLVLLFLTLLTTISSSSSNILTKTEQDTIVSITPNQLKETNLIFVEHKKLLIENELLNNQITNYIYDNNALLKTDSLRKMQLTSYERLSAAYSLQIDELNKEIKKKDKSLFRWKVGSITVSAGLVLWIILK